MCSRVFIGDFHFGLRRRRAGYILPGRECNRRSGHNPRRCVVLRQGAGVLRPYKTKSVAAAGTGAAT